VLRVQASKESMLNTMTWVLRVQASKESGAAGSTPTCIRAVEEVAWVPEKQTDDHGRTWGMLKAWVIEGAHTHQWQRQMFMLRRASNRLFLLMMGSDCWRSQFGLANARITPPCTLLWLWTDQRKATWANWKSANMVSSYAWWSAVRSSLTPLCQKLFFFSSARSRFSICIDTTHAWGCPFCSCWKGCRLIGTTPSGLLSPLRPRDRNN